MRGRLDSCGTLFALPAGAERVRLVSVTTGGTNGLHGIPMMFAVFHNETKRTLHPEGLGDCPNGHRRAARMGGAKQTVARYRQNQRVIPLVVSVT